MRTTNQNLVYTYKESVMEGWCTTINIVSRNIKIVLILSKRHKHTINDKNTILINNIKCHVFGDEYNRVNLPPVFQLPGPGSPQLPSAHPAPSDPSLSGTLPSAHPAPSDPSLSGTLHSAHPAPSDPSLSGTLHSLSWLTKTTHQYIHTHNIVIYISIYKQNGRTHV